MNKMTPYEWEGFKADIIIAFIFGTAFLFGAIIYVSLVERGPTLINEPCAPGKPSIADGEKVGCTDDEASGERWHPGIKE